MVDFFLVTLTLWAFAVIQPLLDLLITTPEFLVIRRATFLELAAMVAIVTLAIPLSCTFLQLIFRTIRLERVGQFFIFTLLGSVYGLLLTHSFWWGAIGGILLSLALSASSALRGLVRFLSLATLVFIGMFSWSVRDAFVGSSRTASSAATASVDTSKVRPTFVVVLDEFPLFVLLNDQLTINAARFPGFAKLAQHTTWFRNASTVTSWTERAVPSLLSGTLPDPAKTQLPSIRDYPQNIFTLFAGTHRVEGFEQVTSLCPPTICREVTQRDPFLTRLQILIEDLGVIYLHKLLPTTWRESLPSIEGKFEGFINHHTDEPQRKKRNHRGLVIKDNRGDDVAFFNLFLQHITSEIPRLQSQGISPLYVIHITFPHVPYRYLPDGRKYFLNRDSNNHQEFVTTWPPDADGVAIQHLQRLVMQTGVVDSLIGSLVDTLQQLNIVNSSALVVTADHGSSFIPGEPARAISEKNHADIMAVPLFISLPGQSRQGAIDDANVFSVDILPTLLELNGIVPATPLDGSSLLRPPPAERTSKKFYPLQKSHEILSFSSPLPLRPSVQQYTALFGNGGFDARFYAPATKFNDLLGSTLAVSSPQVNSTLMVGIHSKEKYLSYRPSPHFHRVAVSGFVRAAHQATIKPAPGKRWHVAIVLNGTVVAISQTDPTKNGVAKFLAIIPPDKLSAGKNSLEGFVLQEE